MPVTSIEDTAALVVIDLQVATAELPTQPTPAADIIPKAAALADAFRAAGRSVVWVTVAGGQPGLTDQEGGPSELPAELTELVPSLGARDGDTTFSKRAWGAFHDGRFDEVLSRLGVRQVVLAGVATSIGVESTARAAYDKGYNVVVVTDAVADFTVEAHEHSVNRVFPGLGQTTTTGDVLAMFKA